MNKWEYKTITVNSESKVKIWNLESELNNLGQEGWELVSSAMDDYNHAVFILKRKIQ